MNVNEKFDFKRNIKVFYLIGIGTGLILFLMTGAFPTLPFIYLGLVLYCHKWYSSGLANVLIWIGAIQVALVCLWIIGRIFQFFF